MTSPPRSTPSSPGHAYPPDSSDADFLRFVNPQSLVVAHGIVEPSVARDPDGTRYQFERQGYFWRDPVDSRAQALVFNRIITLKDTWEKRAESEPAKPAPAAKKPAEAAQVAVRPTLSAEQESVAARLRQQGIGENEATLLAREPELAAYLDSVAAARRPDVASWVVNDLAAAIRTGSNRVTGEQLVALIGLVADGSISARIAKDVLAEAQQSGEAPAQIVERKGLRMVSDVGQLRAAIQGVLDANPGKVQEYRGGKKGLMGFFTGQVMKATNGQADPKTVAKLLGEMLG